MQPFIPKMNISEYRLESFLQEHPEYNLMPREKVVSIMLEKKYINKQQADDLLGKPKIPDIKKYVNPKRIDIAEIFDANFTNSSQKQTSYILKEPKYHKEFKELIIKDNGQIDMSQFDINYLKNKYPSDKYSVNVTPGKFLTVQVLEKQTNKPVVALLYSPDMFTCQYFQGNGNINVYTFDKGKIIEKRQISRSGTDITEYNNKGQTTRIAFITPQKVCAKNILYCDGYPFDDIIQNKNILAEDLHNDITAKTKLGLPTTRKSINTNILKRITKDNVYTVLNSYKQQYGSDLLDDINGEIGLKKEQKYKYIKHIKSTMKNSTERGDAAGRYIAELLAQDIYGLGSGNLKQNIYLINKDNISVVLRNYYDIAEGKNIQSKLKYGSIKIPFMDVKFIPANLIAPLEGLFEAVDMEFGLDEDVLNKLKNYLIDCAKKSGFTEETRSLYTTDIKKDIELHQDNMEKLYVDFMRLGNREVVPSDRYYQKPNGKIDTSFKQGHVGDCWLIASIIAIIQTPEGKKELENLLDYDEKTGDVTVTLKGVSKKYRIKAKEIEDYKQLSNGDGDIRAIEIAIDKYLKESAYVNKESRVDIRGNACSKAFKLLLGNGKTTLYRDLKNKNFNHKSFVYTLGTPDEETYVTAEEENNENKKIKISNKHAYAIIKSDNEYVYLQDTTYSTHKLKQENSDKNNNKEIKERPVIKISRVELDMMNPHISMAKIKN